MELEPLRLLLIAVIVLAACYFLVPQEDGEPQPRSGGNVERDHDLGAHRQVKAFACRKCYP